MKRILSQSQSWMAAAVLAAGSVSGQDGTPAPLILKAEVVEEEKPAVASAPVKATPLDATWRTQKEARTLTLSIPAPRGQIVDRHGVPLAQTRVVNYLALNFPFMEGATREKILAYAEQKIALANRTLGKTWTMEADRLVNHYEHRRWLPLVFSIEEGLNMELSNDEMDRIRPLLGSGLVMQPAYIRYYPKGDSGCHVIGYVGKVRALPTGPIADGDALFEELEGREGLEATFERDLRGTPGTVNMLFSPDGKLLSEEVLRRPVPGRTVVTTLDFNIQKYAENALKKGARNGGSFVIMDVKTGDILAMASNPGFDLNVWVPGIKSAEFQRLNTDPRKPLFPRASFGTYPPASTFKIVTSLGALESGKVTETTAFNCGTSLLIGDRYFHNHSKNNEGMMNVITAIKRSCNTWMYQAALAAGSDAITGMALRLGFGEKTGIPLKAEAAGNVPTNARKLEQRGTKIGGGELANISIGQGEVEATPLQVCQCMAALADGVNLTQPRLVRQIQDVNDQVVMATEVEVRRRIDLNPQHREAVVKGMVAVVSGGGGTGRAAGIKHAQIAGKTGTAQWKIPQKQNLAWFTGFLPANNPVYAFAVLYEGRPGESVSGGGLAAPMVREVFNNVFEKASPDDPLVLAMKDTAKEMEVDEGESDGGSVDSDTPMPSERPIEVKPAQLPEEKKTFKGFFRKLFNKN
jgi:penicillin-binding protein 2